MTWRELIAYIAKQAENQEPDFLDSDIKVYDFDDGSEYEANVTELLFGEDDEETGWVPYLTINHEGDENDNQSETEKASID
jgi:hypothetical protein